MLLPVVLAFEIPGVLVPFPPGPPPTAFKLGLPVPAAPLPAALFEFGDPPPTQPAGGPTSNGSARRSAATAGTAHPSRTHSGANCTTTAATAGQRKSHGQCCYQ